MQANVSRRIIHNLHSLSSVEAILRGPNDTKTATKALPYGYSQILTMSVIFISPEGGGGYISLGSAVVGCMVATMHLMCETMVRTY
jgi:hypothetical protein